MQPADSKPMPRRWRFSLRTFLLLIVALTFCITPLAYELQFYRKCVDIDARARRHFSAMPGHGYQISSEFEQQPFYREWLECPRYPTYFKLYLEDPRFGDDELALVAAFNRNAGDLSLGSADLRNSRVTDVGLKAMQQLGQLHTLKLGHDPFIRGVRPFHFDVPAPLPLDPWPGSEITDRGLMYLSSIQTLKELRLYNTEISDDGLRCLAKLPHLETLYICYEENPLDEPPTGSRITDAGVKHLMKLNSLKRLVVDGTYISEEGMEKLCDGLPGCRVWTYRYGYPCSGFD